MKSKTIVILLIVIGALYLGGRYVYYGSLTRNCIYTENKLPVPEQLTKGEIVVAKDAYLVIGIDKEYSCLKNLGSIDREIVGAESINNLTIGGKIDRIDRNGVGIEIIDYKTGTRVPNERELKESLQLTMYALAATEVHDSILGKKPEEVTLSFYFLEDGIKLTTVRTKEQLEEAKKLILEKAKKISGSDFACSRTSMCEHCEYNMLCG